jgi:hypothetical protein
MSEITQLEITQFFISELQNSKQLNKELSAKLAIALVNPASTNEDEVLKAQALANSYHLQVEELQSKLNADDTEENNIKALYESYKVENAVTPVGTPIEDVKPSEDLLVPLTESIVTPSTTVEEIDPEVKAVIDEWSSNPST